MPTVENVIAFGDSTARGYGATRKRGWLQALEAHYRAAYEDNPAADFFDLTTPGEDAATFFDRTNYVKGDEQICRPHRDSLSVVSIGLNVPSENVRRGGEANDLTRFAKLFTCGLRNLLAFGDVLYVGLAPPDVVHIARGKEVSADRRRESFLHVEAAACDIVAREAALAGRKYGIVPLYELAEGDPRYSHKDGMHPDDIGHSCIFGIVQPVFDDLAGIRRGNDQDLVSIVTFSGEM